MCIWGCATLTMYKHWDHISQMQHHPELAKEGHDQGKVQQGTSIIKEQTVTE